MDKLEILDAIKKNGQKIQMLGVSSIALFGSYARNEAKDNSDIDILVEFFPGKKTFDNYMDLRIFLEDLYAKKIDLVIKESIKEGLRTNILNEAVYAA